MNGELDENLMAWDADRRDFVAAHRDEIATERDTAAEARDAIADKRERLANEREAGLDERENRIAGSAAEPGTGPGDPAGERTRRVAKRASAAVQRHSAREERDQRRDQRDTAAYARETAARLREASTSTSRLALAFAEIARYLYEADNVEDVLTRIVETTVSTVADCDMASITVRENAGTFRTLASTHSAARAVDQAQYDAGEGPSLDAVETSIVHAPSFPDPRWPGLARRPAAWGVEAVVSYRLAAPGPTAGDAVAGSLNAFAGTPQAFGDEAQQIGLVLAAHAAVGIRAAREREASESLGRHLHEALSSRDVIGQAKGILMERLRITPEDAFDTLRRSSQQLNLKLRKIAERLAETGQFDEQPGPDPAGTLRD
jgi:hypothetical protein